VGSLVPWEVPLWVRSSYVILNRISVNLAIIAYLLPVLFHLKLMHKELHWTVKLKDVLILVFGSVALIYSTFLAIQNIVDALTHRSGPSHC